jgi:type I restriction enzyme M protein
MQTQNELKEGYIVDYISGEQVKATPEETEAVQVFAKILVEDYGYPKENIQTRPQYRVKVRPSDTKKEYPVDIAVFTSTKKTEDDIQIIVECKKKNRKDGKSQLQDYLRFSKANLGVWFNGEERFFIRKTENNGYVWFNEIPNIPKYGQRLEDIGMFKRKDLQATHNLKSTFKAIRNHLAANAVGATRDEVLAQQLINLIFCKIYDERFTEPEETVTFRAGIDEEIQSIKERILELFDKVKRKYKEILDETDNITLDSESIVYVVGELQNYCLIEAERDVIADAFETFIGHALKGGQGQFFTPRNVVKMMVDMIDPTEDDTIIDPACGSGGFIIETLRHIWRRLDSEGEKYHWSKNNLQEEKMEVALNRIRGIDKDYFLSKITKAYMAIIGDGKSGIFNEDSLERPENWQDKTRLKIDMGKFSVVLTNPPFGSKIPVSGVSKLSQYDLAYKWSQDKKTGKWAKGKLAENESPEILFIERCLQLLKPGGRMGIVLPDGIFNESETFLRNWLLKYVKIIAIIDVCKETFQPNTSTKTSLLFFEKLGEDRPKDYEIYMGIAYFCGHNRRGYSIDKDDIPTILNNFRLWSENKPFQYSKNCFTAHLSELEKSNFWIPKHFSPYYRQAIDKVKENYSIVKLGKIADMQKGDEPGSNNYIAFIDRNNEDIPFIRTGDLVNSGVNQIPDNFVDKETYISLKQGLKADDILYTKDGKIGITAMITENDKIVIASGILRIRLKDTAKEKYGITPEYIFAVLSNKYTGYFQALRSTVIAATIPHLREKRIEDFDIPIVDKKTIEVITKKIRQSLDFKNQSKILDQETLQTFNESLFINENTI